MVRFVVLFLTAGALSFLLTPLTRSFAIWAKIVDLPSERKIHNKPIPLLGGIPIFISFNLTIILSFIIDPSFLELPFLSSWRALFICQFVILVLGVSDDIMHLEPVVKFLIQISVAVLIVVFGFGIDSITNPANGKIIHLGILSVPITILWVVLITNALNLVDGLDGLASGTALIAATTILAISYFNGNTGVLVASLILAGSMLGFLRFNFYPAKIFLGDTGSLLLGFLLAIFSVQGSSKGATLVAVMAPILALGLPIMETLLSMIRRLLRSIHIVDYPTKNGSFRTLYFKGFSVFKPDRDHAHHRLLKIGLSQKKTVALLYGICIALSLLALSTVAFENINSLALMGAVLLAFFIGIKSLKYREFKILENGLLIPIFDFPAINSRLFLAFFDLLAMAFSIAASFFLVFHGLQGGQRELFVESLPIFLLVKIIVFSLMGIYKIAWTYPSVEDAMSISGAVILSSLGSVVIAWLIMGIQPFGGLVFFLLDFYLLLTLSGGLRLSSRVLNLYYKKGFLGREKKILIYGAGYRGSTVLKEIRHNGNYVVSPVGFIDDDPRKKGKVVHGCPILGSFEDLERISSDKKISEIVVSSPKIGADKIRKLIEFCKDRGVILRQYEFRFYEFS